MPARLVQRFACRFLFEGPVDWHGSCSVVEQDQGRARQGSRASWTDRLGVRGDGPGAPPCPYARAA